MFNRKKDLGIPIANLDLLFVIPNHSTNDITFAWVEEMHKEIAAAQAMLPGRSWLLTDKFFLIKGPDDKRLPSYLAYIKLSTNHACQKLAAHRKKDWRSYSHSSLPEVTEYQSLPGASDKIKELHHVAWDAEKEALFLSYSADAVLSSE